MECQQFQLRPDSPSCPNVITLSLPWGLNVPNPLGPNPFGPPAPPPPHAISAGTSSRDHGDGIFGGTTGAEGDKSECTGVGGVTFHGEKYVDDGSKGAEYFAEGKFVDGLCGVFAGLCGYTFQW